MAASSKNNLKILFDNLKQACPNLQIPEDIEKLYQVIESEKKLSPIQSRKLSVWLTVEQNKLKQTPKTPKPKPKKKSNPKKGEANSRLNVINQSLKTEIKKLEKDLKAKDKEFEAKFREKLAEFEAEKQNLQNQIDLLTRENSNLTSVSDSESDTLIKLRNDLNNYQQLGAYNWVRAQLDSIKDLTDQISKAKQQAEASDQEIARLQIIEQKYNDLLDCPLVQSAIATRNLLEARETMLRTEISNLQERNSELESEIQDVKSHQISLKQNQKQIRQEFMSSKPKLVHESTVSEKALPRPEDDFSDLKELFPEAKASQLKAIRKAEKHFQIEEIQFLLQKRVMIIAGFGLEGIRKTILPLFAQNSESVFYDGATEKIKNALTRGFGNNFDFILIYNGSVSHDLPNLINSHFFGQRDKVVFVKAGQHSRTVLRNFLAQSQQNLIPS